MNRCKKKVLSQQSSVASSTEPSSPAISDSYSHETHSCDMSISITSADGINILPVAEELAKFFPQLEDEDLNAVSVYTPMNTDALEVDPDGVFTFGAGSSRGDASACLTPVSFGMDISMIANKGSMTLSVDGFEDEDEATLSAATTPSLPTDDVKLDMCYCCPTHAEMAVPPDVEDDVICALPEPLHIPDTTITSSSPESHERETSSLPPLTLSHMDYTQRRNAKRRPNDPISPKIKKQISLFEGGEFDRQKEYSHLHASMNIPTAMKPDARLRKFENLTQSTSNSNFPFESNTLKRMPHNANEFADVSHTQSCINLKSSVCASAGSSASGSPQHKVVPGNIVVQSCMAVACTTSSNSNSNNAACGGLYSIEGIMTAGPPRPGALIVKEKFIEPPKRSMPRSFHSKTQSMDADFLFNEFLLVPARSPTHLPQSPDGSGNTSPSTRTNTRFTATKVLEDLSKLHKQ